MSAAASAWGLLPLAIGLFTVIVARLGAVVFDREPLRRQLLGGAVLGVAAVAFAVRLLGAAGLLGRAGLMVALLAGVATLLVVHRERRLAVAWRELFTVESAPWVIAAGGALTVSVAAAYLLPIWQWDSLGYHLPYVDFALQRGALADVPHDLFYISTYPHVVEYVFIAWRAMLPDDRLVDAAQIPFGLLGSLAIATLAGDLGARRDHAVAAGLAWLTLPAVFLQLPTNYVDVGSASLLLASACFVLAPVTARNVLVAGVAIGLFLGSKPNAPVGTVLLFGTLALRAWRVGRRREIAVAAATVLLLGVESYAVNVLRHGNPIWPVEVHLGPVHLPGLKPMSHLLESGAAAPHLTGWGPLRVLRSWITLDAPPAFDMRYGGLGIVFLVSLPAAALALLRRRSLALAVVAGASLASPDPAVARYVLAFPALALALSAPSLGVLGARTRRAVLWVAAAAAIVSLSYAYRGLSGEGPPLASYVGMSAAARAGGVGADGPPLDFLDAHARVQPSETVAFDDSLDLPYLAWPGDLAHRARWIAPDAERTSVEGVVADPSVRLLIVGDLTRAAFLAQPRFSALFHCKSAPCTVYLRR
jgi:hypothetical protein